MQLLFGELPREGLPPVSISPSVVLLLLFQRNSEFREYRYFYTRSSSASLLLPLDMHCARRKTTEQTQGDLESCSANSCPDDQGRDAGAVRTVAFPGDQSVSSTPQLALSSPKPPGVGGEDQDAGEIAGPEEVNTVVSLLVSLNGTDWEPVLGPPLTYFPPPLEPVVEPEEEPKKGKGRKK